MGCWTRSSVCVVLVSSFLAFLTPSTTSSRTAVYPELKRLPAKTGLQDRGSIARNSALNSDGQHAQISAKELQAFLDQKWQQLNASNSHHASPSATSPIAAELRPLRGTYTPTNRRKPRPSHDLLSLLLEVLAVAQRLLFHSTSCAPPEGPDPRGLSTAPADNNGDQSGGAASPAGAPCRAPAPELLPRSVAAFLTQVLRRYPSGPSSPTDLLEWARAAAAFLEEHLRGLRAQRGRVEEEEQDSAARGAAAEEAAEPAAAAGASAATAAGGSTVDGTFLQTPQPGVVPESERILLGGVPLVRRVLLSQLLLGWMGPLRGRPWGGYTSVSGTGSISRSDTASDLGSKNKSGSGIESRAPEALTKVLELLYDIHVESVVQRAVVEYFHISKAAGTSWTAAAAASGCKRFLANGARVRELEDDCRWLNRTALTDMGALQPRSHRAQVCARYGRVHRRTKLTTCRQRLDHVRHRGFQYIANEYTLHGGRASMYDTHICSESVNVITIREPLERLLSNLRYILVRLHATLRWRKDQPQPQREDKEGEEQGTAAGGEGPQETEAKEALMSEKGTDESSDPSNGGPDFNLGEKGSSHTEGQEEEEEQEEEEGGKEGEARVEYEDTFVRLFCGASAAAWEQLAPPVSDNYNIRTMLGERAFHTPLYGIGAAHEAVAKELLIQFDLVLDLESGSRSVSGSQGLSNNGSDLIMRSGLGWGVTLEQIHIWTTARHSSRSGLSLQDCPLGDVAPLLARQTFDLRWYRFGRVLSRLDQLLFAFSRLRGRPPWPPDWDDQGLPPPSLGEGEGGVVRKGGHCGLVGLRRWNGTELTRDGRGGEAWGSEEGDGVDE